MYICVIKKLTNYSFFFKYLKLIMDTHYKLLIIDLTTNCLMLGDSILNSVQTFT